MKNVYVITKTSNELKRKSFLDVLYWIRNRLRSDNDCSVSLRRYTTGSDSGAGKVGGAGGEAAGTFRHYGSVHEDSYFFKKQKEQLKELKKKLDDEAALRRKKEKDDI